MIEYRKGNLLDVTEGIIEQLINDCDPRDTVKKICWEL